MDIRKLVFIAHKKTNTRCRKKYKSFTNRLLNFILTLLIFFVFLNGGTNTNFKALENDGNNYVVTSENDIKNAITAINTGEDGEYSITLGADITIENSPNYLKLEKNSVTIYGENHTISSVASYILVTGNSTLNLGDSNYNKTLSITDVPPQTGNACNPLISVNNATLNMYNGVTLSGRNGVDTTGGVQLEKATFNMYGGEIYNCKSDTAAGGVLAYNNSQFKMYGGTIKNCNNSHYGGGIDVRNNSQFEMSGGTIQGCNSSGSGGGVYVYNSQFEMTGGEIQNCSSTNYGGGVYACGTSQFKMTNGIIKGCTNSTYGGGGICIQVANTDDNINFDMSGGKIINCTATSNANYGLGGGILIIKGLAHIKDGSKIYDNHSSRAGDDVFSLGTNAKLKLSDVPEGLILSDTNHEIDGWYVDGVINGEDTDRWDKDNFAQKYTPSPEELIETQIALKAAHGPTDYNYYKYTVNYYINGILHEELTQTGKANTIYVDNIITPDNCKIDSIEYVNTVEPTSQTPGSFEVNVYCSESDNQEELPTHETDSNDTVTSLTNNDDTTTEQQNNNEGAEPQAYQTGESNLELYIVFGTFFTSLTVFFAIIFNRNRQTN